MENIKRFFENDRFARHVGVEVLDVGLGSARARMAIADHHRNSVGIVHGAAIFALADLVFALAANSHGTVAVAINVSISFLKAARSGALFAEGHEEARNPKLASYRIEVTDDGGDLVATFQGMVYRKAEPLPV
jgi:acyl-CoA thioesterase